MSTLKAIWLDLTSRYSNNHPLIAQLWEEIEKIYSNKKRHYHNLAHLECMLDKALKYRDSLYDLDTVLFSIFYHDIVYDTNRQDNEQQSANIAYDGLTKLGLPSEKITICYNQILATKYHNKADNDTNYFLDFDIAILGESVENYKDYKEKIRKEYAIYPDFIYNKERKKVLLYFLEKENIYHTKTFQVRYEQQARANLITELEGL